MASHFPYVHVLPKFLYKSFLQLCGEENSRIEELLDIKDTKTSIEHFDKVISEAGLQIVDKRYYFINPHYEAKFGLHPRKFCSVFSVPYLRNYFITSCWAILR
jgi:hypothetical protein